MIANRVITYVDTVLSAVGRGFSMFTLKVRAVGNSTGVTLPREVTDRLKIHNGDSVYLTESPDGYRLTPYNPTFERQMKAAESVMRRYKDALRQLAK
jgi:putative addiction module antidote